MSVTDEKIVCGHPRRTKNAYSHFFLIFLSVCAYIIVAMLFQLAAILVTRECFPQLFDSALYDNVLSAISLYVVGLPVAAVIMLFAEARAPEKKTDFTFVKWIGCFCVAVSMLEAGNIMGELVTSLLGTIPGVEPMDAVDEIIGEMPVWASVLLSVVLAPTVEEFIFRKLMIDRAAMFGGRRAIFVSALCFGLMHGNFSQFFYAFFLGLLFGYVYEKTGRLIYTITLHAAVNLVFGVISGALAGSLSGFFDAEPTTAEEMSALYSRYATPIALSSLFGIFTVVAAIVGIVVFAKNIGKLKFDAAAYPLSPREAAVSVWANAGAIVFYAICGFLFASSLIEIV